MTQAQRHELTAENERYIRKMLADREYYGAANDAIPALLAEVDRLRALRCPDPGLHDSVPEWAD
jgi:hypothetical protein